MTETQGETPMTCGRGLAANAALPRLLSELMGAQAEVLQRHTRAIDTNDANAAGELEAYEQLARRYRGVATELRTLADGMASYRELAMPRHDPAALSAPGGQMDAFRAFVTLERQLLELLQVKVESEERLLG